MPASAHKMLAMFTRRKPCANWLARAIKTMLLKGPSRRETEKTKNNIKKLTSFESKEDNTKQIWHQSVTDISK